MVGSGETPQERLGRLTDRDFIAAWRSIFGEPPAVMLARPAMIDLMLDEGPATLVRRVARPAARKPVRRRLTA